MQVILLERVENLGQMGDVVTVKPGYARNFLLPKKMALRATDANRTRFEQERTQLEASNLERKAEADGIAEKVEGLSVVLIRAASDSGQLYGSVNARDIADAVTEAKPGDVILVAGKGHETYQIIGDRVMSFDDRVALRRALDQRAGGESA